jgi:hypothetical protein
MKTRILFLSMAAALVGFYSCTKETKSAPIQFLLTDAPTNYDEVNVHITGMKVRLDKDSTSWISVNVKDSTYNLLDLQNGVTAVLGQDTIPAGLLREVRFILGDGNNIVHNGTTYPMATPSAEHSGLKVKIDKELSETLNIVTLDFDAFLSIKEVNGGYKLDPVIRVK